MQTKKIVPPHRAFLIPEMSKQALAELEQAKKEKRLIYFLDEVMFTKHTLLKRDWNSRGNSTIVSQKEAFTSYTAVIATMTEEHGIGLLHLQKKGVN